jgi:hypothetical protein
VIAIGAAGVASGALATGAGQPAPCLGARNRALAALALGGQRSFPPRILAGLMPVLPVWGGGVGKHLGRLGHPVAGPRAAGRGGADRRAAICPAGLNVKGRPDEH